MGHGNELDIERPKAKAPAERNDVHRNVGRARLPLPLGRKKRSSKGRCMDRNLELRPQIDESAEMIFVRVGEHEAEKIASLLDQIADIGENEIDPRQIVAGEGK